MIKVRKLKDVETGEEVFIAYEESTSFRGLIGAGRTREEALDNLFEKMSYFAGR